MSGSAYNLHNKTTQNKVKIGNYVEERALIETAPAACVPVRRAAAGILSPFPLWPPTRLRPVSARYRA
eukprot:COSAG05_NODE_390_length_10436_cov_15.721196_3_plen_68_part_00